MKNSLIALKCPHCQHSLEGKNTSMVFFCLNCNYGFDVTAKKMEQYSVNYIKPLYEKDFKRIYFPFWKIETHCVIKTGEGDTKENSRRYFMVSAFFVRNINYFGDIGYFYSTKEMEWREDPSPSRSKIFPADRGLRHAVRYPRLYVLHHESKQKSIPDSIDITFKSASICLVPFYKKEGEYIDAMILWTYPSGALI